MTSTTSKPLSRPPSSHGVYGISVTAELSGVGPQTLRLYERRGLIDPGRTDGGTRRYSPDDVERVRRIGELVDLGVNLIGVREILALEDERRELLEQRKHLTELRGRPGGGADHDSSQRDSS
ncbi:MerR family transcriptional regulator [Rhodococcus sp. SGAir0479]|uniref:MerR family transcriptional regulator n=1 Tax=Rhodococcus sp. SGAir0479 TaxID=2567884 RepID=UPI0010CD14A0|nr:MerR family transcriptional regulator [Rhodococcus sp. SGAir0479]QCQ89999.1 MerR family transcriptional regulator [Rhodococcus sp. SGAir0479]